MLQIRTSFIRHFRQSLRWLLLALPVALLTGTVTAFFLWALQEVTRLQWAYPQLLWCLPLGGAVVGLLYYLWGKGSDKGNNLLLDEIHESGGGVPARMAPLVLLGTLLTHLFGGSAGREGTALQMGGSLADTLARLLRVGPENRRLMLMCGISAGFGAVFGTPLSGAIFAIEVLVIGRLQYDAFIPVLCASVVGDVVCTAWGVQHTVYYLQVSHGALHGLLFGKVALAGIAFGLVGRFFSELTHRLHDGLTKIVPCAPLRPALGAAVVILLVYVLGTRDYLGLGVEAPPGGHVSIVNSFQAGGAAPWSWLWKTIFTAVTCGSGFKGGEVTPLFFIGATLGNTLAVLMREPVALFAALGFIGVFAGASNTPMACTIMGIELFGSHYAAYFAVVCFVSYYLSGHSSIYLSQRVRPSKNNAKASPPEMTLKQIRESKARVNRDCAPEDSSSNRPA